MATLQIKVNGRLKTEAQSVAAGMGLDLSTAIRIFLTQMVRENGLPFRPCADPFHSAINQEHLAQVVDDLNRGQNCAVRNLIED